MSKMRRYLNFEDARPLLVRVPQTFSKRRIVIVLAQVLGILASFVDLTPLSATRTCKAIWIHPLHE